MKEIKRNESSNIIGNGDIASVLKEIERPDLLFFASGVSNSKEDRESEYLREFNLLMDQDKSKHLVYFSSLCVFNSDTRYSIHKKTMEEMVKFHFPKYTLVRLGNITWGDNPHTLLNFFKDKLKKNEPFEIQDTYRYLVDKDEFLYWINLIPSDRSCEMNIVGRRLKVIDIVEECKKDI